MILVLQFLGLEDIPVLLLDFLPADNGLNHRALNTTNFIQAIQKFSFAMLRGEDDDRLFNVHFAVIKSIAHFTSMDDTSFPSSSCNISKYVRSILNNSLFSDGSDEDLTNLSIFDNDLVPFIYFMNRFGDWRDFLMHVLAPYNRSGK
jgi:hypothetical protein